MQTINLNVNLEQAQIIISALQKLPFEVVNGLVQNLVDQANEQLKQQEPSEESAE